ncbi:unnamed protein product [Paramecium sonneborni]|uniref:Nudix hydrolase domain-containing protein n=1 Tax=Paramecium sonneborni TaxID=65129 RepID=A0A8S1R426_9CILI|nr:unnamed protein product [Paramecium sonneborni]
MQKIDYGVEVHINQTLYAGRCLLQILKTPVVSYQYQQQQAKFLLAIDQQQWPQAQLLHGTNCPCFNQEFQNNEIKQSKIRLATVAMLCDKNDYFLITRRHCQMKTFPKAWVFPGGMVEKQQHLESECLREVFEETGINTQLIENQMELKVLYESVYPTKLQIGQYPQKQTLCIFYEIKLNESYKNIQVKIQETEVDDYKWIQKNQLLEIMNESLPDEQFKEMSGIYPNQYGSGIGEGHIKAFVHSYKK